MSKKFLVVIISVVMMYAVKSAAQGIVFAPQGNWNGQHPEVLVHIPPVNQDNVIMQDSSFTEDVKEDNSNNVVANETSSPADEHSNEDISYYVQRLHLTPEQIPMAQEISDRKRIEQENLLESIKVLREQAHRLEKESLAEFKAILTEEQREEFNRLRKEAGIVDEEPEPQPEFELQPIPEPQPDVQPEPQPMPESQPDFHPEPQPMPEPQPNVQPEPQPDIQ